MSEVMRWKLKGFIPGVEGMSKAVFQPTVVLAEDYDAAQVELAALREELAEAYNRNAEQRVELDDLHDLKIYATIPLRERCVERKDLQQRLTAAEQRNATLETELRNIRQSCELSKLRDARIDALLVKPTESGASE